MPVRETIERTTTKVATFIPPGEIAAIMASADPFDIEPHDCVNPEGHHFIADCSEVVCLHCARIAWR